MIYLDPTRTTTVITAVEYYFICGHETPHQVKTDKEIHSKLWYINDKCEFMNNKILLSCCHSKECNSSYKCKRKEGSIMSFRKQSFQQ